MLPKNLDNYLSQPVVAGLTGKCLLKMGALLGVGFLAGRYTHACPAPAPSNPQTLVLTMPSFAPAR